MVLFSIEYEIVSTKMTFKCDCVGVDERDVVNDLMLQVGVIKVISLYRKSGINRISNTIRKQIIENYLPPTSNNKKRGRTRLPD